MLRCIGTLELEHQEAFRLLKVFDQHLQQLRENPQLDSRAASPLVGYLAEVLFSRHEEKEQALFSEVVRAGCSRELPLLRQQAKDHVEIRALLKDLIRAFTPGQAWTTEAREHFLRTAHAWSAAVKKHIKDEELFMFAELDRWIDEDLQDVLEQEFRRIDAAYIEPEDVRMGELAARFVHKMSESSVASPFMDELFRMGGKL